MHLLRKSAYKFPTFTSVSNDLIEDWSLTLEARMLLIWLLKLPDNWEFTINSLTVYIANRSTAAITPGKRAISRMIDELITARYITRQRVHADGHFKTWAYYVSPTPIPEDFVEENLNLPNENLPDADSENLNLPNESSHQENSPHSTTYKINKDKENNDLNKIKIKNARAKKFSADELEPFRLVWNRDKAPQWAACDVLNSERVKSLNKLILDEGELALELFEKAIAFIKTEKWWLEKRISIDMLIRPSKGHVRAYAERYLATPSGRTVQNLDIKKAVELQERNRRLALLEDV